MRPFSYVDATSVEDAVELLREEPDSAVIAGGTDLLVLMKNGLANPRLLVNVKTIQGLARIGSDGAGGLVVGSLATMAALGDSQLVRASFPILGDAIRLAASPQIRNAATVGGNLCQRPRCWYYRGTFDCYLKGDTDCPALHGEDRDAGVFGRGACRAVNPSDLAPALVALGGSLVLQNTGGRREIPLEEFLTTPTKASRHLNSLSRDEIIVAVRIPKQTAGATGIYLKAMERKAWSFAQASVAIQLSQGDGRVIDPRIVLGGVAPIPWRARAAEDVLRARAPNPEIIARAAQAATKGAHPLAGNGYKVALVQALVKRGLSTLLAIT